MQHLPPSQTPKLEVLDSLRFANVDVGPALGALQGLIGTNLVGNDLSAGNITASGNVVVSGTVSALRMSVASVPTVGSHLCNRTYVDGLGYITAGTGLILSRYPGL